MGVPELESGTSSLSATRSNQLSYTPESLASGGCCLDRLFPRDAANQSDESYGMSVPCKGKPTMNLNETGFPISRWSTMKSACKPSFAAFDTASAPSFPPRILVRFPLVSFVDRLFACCRLTKFAVETDISTAEMVRHNTQVNEIP